MILKLDYDILSEPPEVGHMSFSKEVMNEGDFGQLVCTVIRGDEPLSITWSLHGDVVSSEPSLTTSQIGTRTSMLMINSVGHRHSGIYTCNVSNAAGSVATSTELKVNGIKLEKGIKEVYRIGLIHHFLFKFIIGNFHFDILQNLLTSSLFHLEEKSSMKEPLLRPFAQ